MQRDQAALGQGSLVRVVFCPCANRNGAGHGAGAGSTGTARRHPTPEPSAQTRVQYPWVHPETRVSRSKHFTVLTGTACYPVLSLTP